MSHPGQTGLRAKIGVAFILQAAAISCGTVLGVYAAAAILEDVLMKRALREETAHYIDCWNAIRCIQRPTRTT